MSANPTLTSVSVDRQRCWHSVIDMARLLLRGSHHTEILANCAEINRADLRHDALAGGVEATPRLGLRSMLLKLDPRERCAGALGHEPVMPLVKHPRIPALQRPGRSWSCRRFRRAVDRERQVLDQLIALHEHITVTQDTIWDISSSRCRSLPPSTEMRRPSLGRRLDQGPARVPRGEPEVGSAELADASAGDVWEV